METSDDMDPMRAFDPDVLLAEAAALAPARPDADFMARLMADAQQAQPPMPMPNLPRAAPAPAPRARTFGPGSVIGALADVFGGRGALAAMMLATVTGLYIGVAQPALVSNLTGLSADSPLESLDLMSGSDSLWTESTQ